MKKLHEIITEIAETEQMLREETKLYEKTKSTLTNSLAKLKELQDIALSGLDIQLTQIATQVLHIYGNISGTCQGERLTDLAAVDIAKGCPHLKTKGFSNKRYEGFYQREDHNYGYGPKHGYIVDEIELRQQYRTIYLTDEQKDACIYYLKNYSKIQQTATT